MEYRTAGVFSSSFRMSAAFWGGPQGWSYLHGTEVLSTNEQILIISCHYGSRIMFKRWRHVDRIVCLLKKNCTGSTVSVANLEQWKGFDFWCPPAGKNRSSV
jgi:hypothetical protein